MYKKIHNKSNIKIALKLPIGFGTFCVKGPAKKEGVFSLNSINGLLEISKNCPKWLVCQGTINTNPLGGIFGISLMALFCFLNFRLLREK